MVFCGGPFNDGHHQAVREYLEKTFGPIPEPDPSLSVITDADIDRLMPRSFKLFPEDSPAHF